MEILFGFIVGCERSDKISEESGSVALKQKYYF